MFIRLLLVVSFFLLGNMSFPQRGMASEPQRVQAALISLYDAIVPYGETPIGLQLTIEPGWHVYWQNPGDSGLAPQVTWQNLSENLSIEIMPWPVPQKIITPPLASYGYENKVLIPFNLHLEDGLPGQLIEVSAMAEWLVCKEICISEKQQVSLALPTAEVATEVTAVAAQFRETFAQTPLPAPDGLRAETDGKHIDILLPPGVQEALFIPATESVIFDAGEQPVQKGRLRIELDPTITTSSQAYLSGLVIASTGNWQIDVALESVASLPAFTTFISANDLLFAVVFALLGGLLLNLMPCVLPVLSLKVLGIAKQKSAHQRRVYGQFYSLGVVAAFVVLGLILLALRATGEGLGWGFQLQSPVFVASLIILFTLITLNLLNVFQVSSPVNAGVSAVEDTSRRGAFMSGVLAAAVASPCTVPFMGSAVAYALTTGGLASLLIFATLGFGLAAPFLLLAYVPKLSGYLPKPGAWMVTFKKILAIPMAATVVWLIWVYLQQIHFTYFWTFVALLALGFALAGMFRFSNNLLLPQSKRYACYILAAGLFMLALIGVQQVPIAQKVEYNQQVWQPFSEAKVRDLTSQGKDVFVAFTAAWCITCKANEYLVLHTPETEALFKQYNIVPMLADWTNRDAMIAEVLAKHGSQGVPFYLLYTQDGGVHTLPTLLTQDGLKEAILKVQ